LTPIVANPANVLLMTEGGGFLFTQQEPCIYEVHSQFLPEHRGSNVLKAAADAARWMFTRTDCTEILSKVPDGNVAAAAFAKAMKWEYQFSRPNVWPTPTGFVGLKYYRKDLMQWASQAMELAEVGEKFHATLADAKHRMGTVNLPHEDDAAHDRYVGVTVEMMQNGQIEKAMRFYAKWARFAGYGPISIIAINPVVIDIGDAIIALKGGWFEVILCR